MSNIYESDLFASRPGRSMHPGGLRLTNRAARLAGLREGMLVADIGCGTGETCAFLEEKYGLRAIGLDISGTLVTEGLGRHPGLELIHWDCLTFPFEPDSLDAVLFECTLSVIGHAPAVLSDAAEALKPSGLLIVSDVCAKTAGDMLSGRSVTVDALEAQITAAGFTIAVSEDHTAALRTYAAELATYDGVKPLAAELLGNCAGCQNVRLSHLGYRLIIARQNERS